MSRATSGPGTPAVFSALGDERRLWMLKRLAAEGPLSIGALTRGSGVTRQAVTKHLDVLEHAGLVTDRRDGRKRLFDIETENIERARRDLDAISARWDRAVQRLRERVERPRPPGSPRPSRRSRDSR